MNNCNPFNDHLNLSPNLYDAAKQILEAQLIPGTRIGDSRGPYVGGSRVTHSDFIRGFSSPKERSSRMRTREELDAISAETEKRKEMRAAERSGRTFSGKVRIAAGMSPGSGVLTSDETKKLRETGIAGINLPDYWEPDSSDFNTRIISGPTSKNTLGRYSTTYTL